MELRILGTTGLRVSALCLGTMTFGDSRGFMKGHTASLETARRMLDMALDAGLNFIDTANIYSEGQAEEMLGQWLGARRNGLILATKARFPMSSEPGKKPGPNDSGASRRHLMRACEASLRRLKTDCIDLYQVHMQDTNVPIEETLRTLQDLQRAGKVRAIGCSNYTGFRLTQSLWAAEKWLLPRYQSVQLKWNVVERGAECEVIPVCRHYNLGVMVWAPLASGYLSDRFLQSSSAPEDSRLAGWGPVYEELNTPRNQSVLKVLHRVAKRHEVSISRVALAWLLQRQEVSTIILGARTVEQLEDNLNCLTLELTPGDLTEIGMVSAPQLEYPYNFILRVQGGL